MGRPLIATDVPGCRDVVQDGINGYLCSARDSRALADAMEKMIRSKGDQWKAMGAAQSFHGFFHAVTFDCASVNGDGTLWIVTRCLQSQLNGASASLQIMAVGNR